MVSLQHEIRSKYEVQDLLLDFFLPFVFVSAPNRWFAAPYTRQADAFIWEQTITVQAGGKHFTTLALFVVQDYQQIMLQLRKAKISSS
jgi:hypothetical protein